MSGPLWLWYHRLTADATTHRFAGHVNEYHKIAQSCINEVTSRLTKSCQLFFSSILADSGHNKLERPYCPTNQRKRLSLQHLDILSSTVTENPSLTFWPRTEQGLSEWRALPSTGHSTVANKCILLRQVIPPSLLDLDITYTRRWGCVYQANTP